MGILGNDILDYVKKHDEPTTDIKKIIQESTFLLSSILGKEYKAKLLDEQGIDLLNEKEEDFSPFDKLHSLLNDQEKELLKDKNIKVIHINGLRMLEDFIREKEDRRNGKHEANR